MTKWFGMETDHLRSVGGDKEAANGHGQGSSFRVSAGGSGNSTNMTGNKLSMTDDACSKERPPSPYDLPFGMAVVRR